jgi:hypothetical protein
LIELHIGNKNKKSRRKFYEIAAKTILVALRKKKDILVLTSAVKKETVQQILGQAAEFHNPTLFDYTFCKLCDKSYSNKAAVPVIKKHPLIKFVIKPDSLLPVQIDYIQGFIKTV